MYPAAEILLQCWNLHIRCRATVSSRVSRDCMFGYFGFFYFIYSLLLLLIAVVLVWRRMSSGSKKGELSALLVCTFKSLFLFSTLGSTHTQHTNIKFYVIFFFSFFEYAIKLFKSSTIKPQFFTSSSNAKLSLLSSDVRKKLSTLDTDLFFDGFLKSWVVHFFSVELFSGKNGCTVLNMYIACMQRQEITVKKEHKQTQQFCRLAIFFLCTLHFLTRIFPLSSSMTKTFSTLRYRYIILMTRYNLFVTPIAQHNERN